MTSHERDGIEEEARKGRLYNLQVQEENKESEGR
jgi:hypothetical protein